MPNVESTSKRERIEAIMEAEGLIAAQFASEIDIKSPTLSHILNDRNNPSLEVVEKILDRYKDIDPEWLIFGRGEMYRENNEPKSHSLFDNQLTNTSERATYVNEQPSNTPSLKNTNEPPATAHTHQPQPVSHPYTQIEGKKIINIITYFDDGTFEEFLPHKQR